MQIAWNKIKKEYPKSYSKYLNTFKRYDIDYLYEERKNNNKNETTNNYYFEKLPEESCYCDLEKFFDENGIIINLQYTSIGKWQFKINYNKDNENYISDGYKSRPEAKLQAIYKTFEIMEEKLK